MMSKQVEISDSTILDEYCQLYADAYGKEAEAYDLGYGWFLINEDMCHSSFLRNELPRLREMVEQQKHLEQQKSLLKDVVKRLRGF